MAPETSDIQQSLNNAALHLGIAFGTFIGSIVADQWSVEMNSHVGVIFVVVALFAAMFSLNREREIV